MSELPAIGFALALGSEARWSDMLAVLIATDPVPVLRLLGANAAADEVHVEREVAVDAANRPDIVLHSCGRRVAVIEVKVLAGLGHQQLRRYVEVEPNADAYVLIYPQRLPIDTTTERPWKGITWEDLLGACAASANVWVATTARAWLAHLDRSVPVVHADTRWNDLVEGEDFVLALRSRVAWLHRQMRPPAPIRYDLSESSLGASWVARMLVDACAPGYKVLAEVEERLASRDYPKHAGPQNRQPLGPSARVALMQEEVTTSAGFDWDYLLAVWPVMATARTDWVTYPARPRAAHDKAGHAAMVAKGGPPHLGSGFGEAQTRITKACVFGARVQFPPDITLGELAAAVHGLADLVLAMSKVPQPGT